MLLRLVIYLLCFRGLFDRLQRVPKREVEVGVEAHLLLPNGVVASLRQTQQ